MKDNHFPPLVTAGSPMDPVPGAIGQRGTLVVFGGDHLESEVRSGGRFTVGSWLNDCRSLGVEGNYFFLGSRNPGFTTGLGADNALIARPFTDALTGQPAAAILASPALAGSFNLTCSSRLWGAEANALGNVMCCGNCRIDVLAGFRYLELDEGVNMTQNGIVTPIPVDVLGRPMLTGTTRFTREDEFDTHNRFYGGQIGARAEYHCCRFFANATAKVALGGTRQISGINGSTATLVPGEPGLVRPGGFYAQPSNSGHTGNDEFSVVPEVALNVGFEVNCHLRARFGYTFIYWTEVFRPGDQIDQTVNFNQGPGLLPNRPLNLERDHNFWAQGLNFGVEFHY
jgi:hypothetical protein